MEGITDVWRLGPGAVCTFGVGYTPEQLNFLCSRFDSFILMFDGDDPGQKSSAKMASELSFRGKDVLEQHIAGDPGNLKPEFARKLMKSFWK